MHITGLISLSDPHLDTNLPVHVHISAYLWALYAHLPINLALLPFHLVNLRIIFMCLLNISVPWHKSPGFYRSNCCSDTKYWSPARSIPIFWAHISTFHWSADPYLRVIFKSDPQLCTIFSSLLNLLLNLGTILCVVQLFLEKSSRCGLIHGHNLLFIHKIVLFLM